VPRTIGGSSVSLSAGVASSMNDILVPPWVTAENHTN
jgi:hypothetical protein